MANGKSNWLRIVLIVSLVLNLFLLGAGAAVLSKSQKMKTPGGRLQLVAKELKLTQEQKLKLWRMTKPVRQYRKQMRQAHMQEINALGAELAKQSPDYDKINQLIGKMAEARGQFLGFAAEKLEPFLQELTLEQRRIIVHKIESLKKVSAAPLE